MSRDVALRAAADGFTEAVTKSGQMLGEEGLVALIREGLRSGAAGPELLQDLFWRLTQRVENYLSLSDDVSAALLEYDIGT